MNYFDISKIGYIVGVLIILYCAGRGFRKGMVRMVSSVVASGLLLLFFYLLKMWAFESFFVTILTDYMVLVVRILLCIGLYLLLFIVLKALILSLGIITRLKLIRVLDKAAGLLLGALHGALIAGIIYGIFSWIGLI